jgi:hypothetical protein
MSRPTRVVTDVAARFDDDPAGLAAAILDEEAHRRAAQAATVDERVIIADDLLPGVGWCCGLAASRSSVCWLVWCWSTT